MFSIASEYFEYLQQIFFEAKNADLWATDKEPIARAVRGTGNDANGRKREAKPKKNSRR